MKLLDKLEKKFGKYAIKNLMYYIILLYGLGFAIVVFRPDLYTNYLCLNAEKIIQGEIWRIFTYIIFPPSGSMLTLLISLYFYYTIGSILERQWGSFRFNLYFLTGVLLNAIAVVFIYFVFEKNLVVMGANFLNLSLFFAFATVNSEAMVLFMWILPIKMKYLAMIEGIYFGVIIVSGLATPYLPESVILGLHSFGIVPNMSYAVMALMSLLNFLIYALSIRNVRRMTPKEVYRRKVHEHKVEQAQAPKQLYRHKCAICGRTELDSPDLDFRYCSKCEGNYEYCQDHLFTHEHVKNS